MYNVHKIKEKVELYYYNIQLLKRHITNPEFGTVWYWTIGSRSYFFIKVFIYLFIVLGIFFLFIIGRTLRKYQSLVLFIYICWFFSSLFYIEFIRV